MQALYAVERMAMSVLSVTTPESKIGLSAMKSPAQAPWSHHDAGTHLDALRDVVQRG